MMTRSAGQVEVRPSRHTSAFPYGWLAPKTIGASSGQVEMAPRHNASGDSYMIALRCRLAEPRRGGDANPKDP